MATVGGVFEVGASSYQEIELDTEGMSLEEIAQALEDDAPGISLCYECAGKVSDPELGDLSSLNIDGVEHIQDEDGAWIVYDPDAPLHTPERNPLRDLAAALADIKPPQLPPGAREAFVTFCRQFNDAMNPAKR